MEYYFIVHTILGMVAGASGWTAKRAKVSVASVPLWAHGPWGSLSSSISVLGAFAAVITTAINYPLVWSLATIGELFLGAFIVGFLQTSIIFLLTMISIPVNIVILGSLWGFWYL